MIFGLYDNGNCCGYKFYGYIAGYKVYIDPVFITNNRYGKPIVTFPLKNAEIRYVNEHVNKNILKIIPSSNSSNVFYFGEMILDILNYDRKMKIFNQPKAYEYLIEHPEQFLLIKYRKLADRFICKLNADGSKEIIEDEKEIEKLLSKKKKKFISL